MPTVPPPITAPTSWRLRYDRTSLSVPRMYGSSDRKLWRTNTCPGPGVGVGVSTRRKQLGVTFPAGRRSSSTCRLAVIGRFPWEASCELRPCQESTALMGGAGGAIVEFHSPGNPRAECEVSHDLVRDDDSLG